MCAVADKPLPHGYIAWSFPHCCLCMEVSGSPSAKWIMCYAHCAILTAWFTAVIITQFTALFTVLYTLDTGTGVGFLNLIIQVQFHDCGKCCTWYVAGLTILQGCCCNEGYLIGYCAEYLLTMYCIDHVMLVCLHQRLPRLSSQALRESICKHIMYLVT